MPELIVARALSAFVASRYLRIASIIFTVVFLVLLVGIWLLATYFSTWYWLLAVPILIVGFIFFVIRIAIRFIIRRIYSKSFTSEQSVALESIADKIQRILEARGTPPIFIVFICIKDILFHRDITTMKQLINDTTSLKRDYVELERLF